MFTLWFTGSDYYSMRAIAKEVEKFLKAKKLTVIYLDKYNCMGVRHAAYVAELLNEQGAVVVASFYASYLNYRTSVKSIITKHIEVWVKGADKTHVFAQESCDILVDLSLNTVQSCASLVASYLYLYKVIKLSENGIDPIVDTGGLMKENKFRVYCEFEFEGEIVKTMESPASWFALTQIGKLMTYDPLITPKPIEKEYKVAVPLFYTGYKDVD